MTYIYIFFKMTKMTNDRNNIYKRDIEKIKNNKVFFYMRES